MDDLNYKNLNLSDYEEVLFILFKASIRILVIIQKQGYIE